MYKHPGVYIEHVPSGVLAIEAASTSVAAFIGPVKRGELVTADKEAGEPQYVTSQAQFTNLFGSLDGSGGGIRNLGSNPDRFGHAVQAFFANGGKQAYIVPVGDGNGDASTAAFLDPLNAGMGFYFTAKSAGLWADGLEIHVSRAIEGDTAPESTYDVQLGLPDGRGGLDPVLETHTDLSLDTASGQFLADRIDKASELVSVSHEPVAAGGGAVTALESDSLAALNFGDITGASTVELTFTGDTVAPGNAVTVTFAGTEGTLAELAAKIQADVRADGSTAAEEGFVAVATRSSTILLIPGMSGADGTVNEVAATDGTAQATLGLNPGTAVDMPQPWGDQETPLTVTLAGGADHGDPSANDYSNALIHLRDYRDISILLLPDKNWVDGDNSEIEAAITHAEFMQNRMVIVDPPDPVGDDRLETPKDVKDLGVSTSPYAALYYPWMEVTNPYHDPDTAANLPKTFKVGPAGFAAGMWARIDGRRGVWKAPAGLEATVRGAIGPTIDIGNGLQDNLNEFGVNCLRSIIGPTVIWGARTRATKSKPEYRYVPVRRTQSMIGESLYRALQAVVFEPNDHRLWGSLRANVGAFMDTLHRAGAFQGEKASEAYYVQCGLGTTMTQADIDAGVVRVVVGFAPLKPAEFVVVQIKQIVGQAA